MPARVVDQGRIVTAGGITSGMEKFIAEGARVMEYSAAYDVYRSDRA